MKTEIKNNIKNPMQLEKLYQSDKNTFEKAFSEIYDDISESELAEFWKVRLNNDKVKIKSSNIQNKNIWYLIFSSIIAGFLIKIPQLFGIDTSEYYFYGKNAGLIVFIGLSIYFFLSNKTVKLKNIIFTIILFTISAVYINLLPDNPTSNSVIMAFIHLPLMLWCLFGLIYIDFNITDKLKRMNYIRYNGDLGILGAIVLIAGGIMTAVTLGLFEAIDLHIEEFYFENIVTIGLVVAPIVVTFIIQSYSSVASKIAPIIAKIFSPLVLITLIIYLISIIATGKDPYNDRDFLIAFNLMLLGVMGIVVFSITEVSNNRLQKFNSLTLLLLSMITLIVDLVALSAIIYRLGEFGFTPNRTVVLGANLLIFGNLLMIMIDLYKVNFKRNDFKRVELTIAIYLPIYLIWTIFVIFILPFVFGFK